MSEEIKTGETKTPNPDEWLSGWIKQTLYVVVRGLLSAAPNFGIEKVLMLTCFNLARIVSELYAGDELSVRHLRKGCRDLFDETLKQMPVVPLADGAAKKPDTAAIGG